MTKKDKKPYPSWVCHECAVEALKKDYEKYRKWMKVTRIACYHEGLCEVCGKAKTVTEPRDYLYPEF